MKNTFLLLLFPFIFINCSSNDETPENNSLIGTWKQVKLIINKVDSQSECIEKNYISFKEDNSLLWARHLNPDCKLDEGKPYTGIWQKVNNTSFTFKTDEGFVLKLITNNTIIEVQEDNDNSRTWIFKR